MSQTDWDECTRRTSELMEKTHPRILHMQHTAKQRGVHHWELCGLTQQVQEHNQNTHTERQNEKRERKTKQKKRNEKRTENKRKKT